MNLSDGRNSRLCCHICSISYGSWDIFKYHNFVISVMLWKKKNVKFSFSFSWTFHGIIVPWNRQVVFFMKFSQHFISFEGSARCHGLKSGITGSGEWVSFIRITSCPVNISDWDSEIKHMFSNYVVSRNLKCTFQNDNSSGSYSRHLCENGPKHVPWFKVLHIFTGIMNSIYAGAQYDICLVFTFWLWRTWAHPCTGNRVIHSAYWTNRWYLCFSLCKIEFYFTEWTPQAIFWKYRLCVHEWNKFKLTLKKNQIFCFFYAFICNNYVFTYTSTKYQIPNLYISQVIQLQITTRDAIGNNNRYSHGIYRYYPSAPEISIYLYTFRNLYGNCIGMHKLLPFSKFMRFPTLFYNV